MNTAPVVFEPIRYGITGPGIVCGMRFEFYDDALSYGLNAPDFIATGSTKGYLQSASEFHPAQHYISYTETRRQW